MKKPLILLAILFITLSYVVHGEIDAEKLSCSDEGILSFYLVYTCTDDWCHEYSEECSDDPNSPECDEPTQSIRSLSVTVESEDKEYNITGAVYNTDTDRVVSVLREETKYKFTSEDYELEPNKDYNVQINVGKKSKTYSVECSDFKYLTCKKANLKAHICGRQEKNAYFIFSGLNQDFTQAELRQDIDYYVNPATEFSYPYRKATMSEEMPSSFEVLGIDSDYYLLKVPILDLKNREIKDFFVRIKDCNEDTYNVSAYKSCRAIECYEAKDCPVGTSCNLDENKCELLECSPCERVLGNKCISDCKARNICEDASCDGGVCNYKQKENCCEKESDCDDGSVCTTDKCENNKCTYADVKCPASADPCVVGVCKEPDGCEYGLNPECYDETAESEQNKITGAAVVETKEAGDQSIIQKIVSWFINIFS